MLASSLRSRAQAWGLEQRVHWHGSVTRTEWVAQLLRAEICLLPSRYEGFGLACVEAMAASVPVVARDIPAFRALVPEPSRPLLHWDDPETAAAQLQQVRDADLVARGAACREAARPHSWELRAGDWEAAYRRLLEAP